MLAWFSLIVLAAPIVVEQPDGRVDWTTRTVHARGVGTPKILSHTGGITPVDPLTAAKADLKRRLGVLLKALPVDGRETVATRPRVDGHLQKAAAQHVADKPLYFSDGTVHLPGAASFAFPYAPRAVDPLAPTGLIITLSADIDPRLRLTLTAPGVKPVAAGLPDDRVAPAGIVWVRGKADETQLRHVGPQPLAVAGAPGDALGQIALGADAVDALLGNSLNALMVVLP